MPFDETIVKYYWISDRVFEIVDIELRSKNKTVLIEQALLTTEGNVSEEVQQRLAQESEVVGEVVEEEVSEEGESVLIEEEF